MNFMLWVLVGDRVFRPVVWRGRERWRRKGLTAEKKRRKFGAEPSSRELFPSAFLFLLISVISFDLFCSPSYARFLFSIYITLSANLSDRYHYHLLLPLNVNWF